MYYFIVNPRSRSGQGMRSWKKVQDILLEQKIPHRAAHTTHSGHARELANKLTQDSSAKTIIILGGDGTLNEVVNGLNHMDNITIGYIPTGSSNDFAKSLGIDSDPETALMNILHPASIVALDLATITNSDISSHFVVSCGMGYDAAICEEALTSNLKKILNLFHFGKLTYIMIGLKQLAKLKPSLGTLVIDNNDKIALDNLLFVSAQLHPYEGGGVKFCPQADPTDGLLDICIINGKSKWKMIVILAAALAGKHTGFKEVLTYQCNHVSITTNRPLPIHTDGEIFQHCNEITAACCHDKINIIVK